MRVHVRSDDSCHPPDPDDDVVIATMTAGQPPAESQQTMVPAFSTFVVAAGMTAS
jgi:hypothetical protein